jgi:thioredoxin-related protein
MSTGGVRLGRWALLLMFLHASLAGAVTLRDPDTAFFNQSLGDLSEELEIAREEGKQGVLLFFEQDECPFCARMKRDVLNRSEVQDYRGRHRNRRFPG